VCVCVRGTSDLFCFIVRERGLWAAQLSFPLIYWYLPRYSILTHLYHHPHQHHHSQMPKNNKSKSQQQQKQPEQQQQQQVRLGRQPQWSVSEARVTSYRSDSIPSPMDAVMSPTDYVSVGGNSSSSSSSYGTGAGIANLDCDTPTSTPETPFEREATATDADDADEDEAEVAEADAAAEPDADQYSDVEKIEIEFVPGPSSSNNGATTAAVPTQEQEAPEWGGERPEDDDGYEIVASGSGLAPSTEPATRHGVPVDRVESAAAEVSGSSEPSVPVSGASGSSSSSSSSNPPPTPVPPCSQPAAMSPTTAKAAGTITEIGASATVKAKKTPTSKTTCFRYGFKAPEAELEPTQRDHMPLRVIGAGWGRTGTRSLKAALDILGIKTYHMVRAVSILDCVAPFPALLIT
jgi:hypothetical protein